MHPHLTSLYNLRLADEKVMRSQAALERLDWGDSQVRAIHAVRAEAVTLMQRKTQLDKDLKACETALETVVARIRRSEKRLRSSDIHNAHELESTEKELAALKTQQGELEDRVLELMEAVEKFPAQAQDIRRREQALIKEREVIRKRSTDEKAKLDADIAAATQRGQELSSTLPREILERYRRMRPSMNGLAVSRVVNGACGECRTTVLPVIVKNILQSDELVPCQNCSRILYTDE